MDNRDFFDLLYQMWSKTTHANDRYWDYQPDERDNGMQTVRAVGPDGGGLEVAWGVFEPDADWITAVHGAFPDLYRLVMEALDEADRLDREMDEAQDQLAEAHLRIMELESDG